MSSVVNVELVPFEKWNKVELLDYHREIVDLIRTSRNKRVCIYDVGGGKKLWKAIAAYVAWMTECRRGTQVVTTCDTFPTPILLNGKLDDHSFGVIKSAINKEVKIERCGTLLTNTSSGGSVLFTRQSDLINGLEVEPRNPVLDLAWIDSINAERWDEKCFSALERNLKENGRVIVTGEVIRSAVDRVGERPIQVEECGNVTKIFVHDAIASSFRIFSDWSKFNAKNA